MVESSKKLENFARDKSMYYVLPKKVFLPKNEQEVIGIVHQAKKQGVSITARGGGTGLSGACIGEDWVVDFSVHMKKIIQIGKMTRVQSGILLKDFRPELKKKGYFLPSVPLHGDCAIGGNVNTRSVGPESLKYGFMDEQVSNLRGVLADGRILDTSKTIPEDLEKKILLLRKELKKNKSLSKYILSRPPIAGGYRLRAFLDYSSAKNIIKKLIPGSVGTLLLLTEVELSLPKIAKKYEVYLIHFSNYEKMQLILNNLIKLDATGVEFAGEKVLALWDKPFQYPGSAGVFIAEFEKEVNMKTILPFALNVNHVPSNEHENLWKSRQKTLPKLEEQAKKMGMACPSIVDDTSIHPEKFGKILSAIDDYASMNRLDISSFGHAGVGSIHLRVFIDLEKEPQQLEVIGEDIFKIVHQFGGTLIGEHNSGRCRSHFLAMENKAMYAFMHKVKVAFDPENLFNPHIMFDLPAITKNIRV